MSLNTDLSDLFHSLSALMELKGENMFKVIAFQKVSRIIRELNIDLKKAMDEGKLSSIEGIGKGSQQIIEEFIQTGKSSVFAEIAASVPAGLVPMMSIEGLGPKTIHLVWKQLNVTSVDELSKAIESGQLAGLKGMGAKKIASIKAGIDAYLSRAADGTPVQRRMGIAEALEVALPLLDAVRKIDGVTRAEIAGSLRRRKETVADVDLIAAVDDVDDAGRVIKKFVNLDGVIQTLGAGASKGSVKVSNGMQVDLRVVPTENFGAALLYFTGSKEHNVKIRGLAQKQKMTLNEWGLYKLDEYEKAEKRTAMPPATDAVASKTEESIYKKLGLSFIEPEMREDFGEVELARLENGSKLDDKQLHSKYLFENLNLFAFHSTAERGPNLVTEQMAVLELALLLDFPDADPRRNMPSKRGYAEFLPRFNAWDNRYNRFGSTISEIRQKIASRLSEDQRLSDEFAACRKLASGNASADWRTSGSKRGANIPKTQGVYFLRNASGSVNEGYIGVAGIGTANTLSNRLGMHFSGNRSSDNLIRRYEAEEEYVANASRLPVLITRADIRGDLHTHTTASDGKSSIEEMAEAAKALGYEYLAITDHSKAMAMANGLSVERLMKHIEAIHRVSDKLKGITLLAGAECDILADGRMDYDDDVLKELDIVIASPHISLKQDAEKSTARLLRAIENRYVNVIGHPTGRLINGRSGLPLKMDEIFKAAAASGTALEINSGYPRLDLNDTNARAAIQAGCMLSINTDSHTNIFDEIIWGIGVARRAWVTKQNVINCLPLSDLRAFLKKKR